MKIAYLNKMYEEKWFREVIWSQKFTQTHYYLMDEGEKTMIIADGSQERRQTLDKYFFTSKSYVYDMKNTTKLYIYI